MDGVFCLGVIWCLHLALPSQGPVSPLTLIELISQGVWVANHRDPPLVCPQFLPAAVYILIYLLYFIYSPLHILTRAKFSIIFDIVFFRGRKGEEREDNKIQYHSFDKIILAIYILQLLVIYILLEVSGFFGLVIIWGWI